MTFGGGGGAALATTGGGSTLVTTFGLGRTFGAGANFVAGFEVLTLGLGGGAFKAATFDVRERGFFDLRLAVRLFLEVLPGGLRVTFGKSCTELVVPAGGRLTSKRDRGVRAGGSSKSPVRLGSITAPPAGAGPTPLSPRTLKSTMTWLVASHDRS